MNVILVQLCVPTYRLPLFSELAQLIANRAAATKFEIVHGASHAGGSPKTDPAVSELAIYKPTNNYWLGSIVAQRLPLRVVLADCVVVEGNPRIASNWVVLALRRLSGRRTVVWGHKDGHSGGLLGRMRRIMFNLADMKLFYMREECDPVKGGESYVSNSLYHRSELSEQPATRPAEASPQVLYVGRLVPDKEPEVIIEALSILHSQGHPVRLVIVGEGTERGTLSDLIARLTLEDHVDFAGEIYDARRLRQLYEQSVASVTGGYVGLGIIQSLGFATPHLYRRSSRHSPEIALSRLSCSLEWRTAEELAAAILAVIRDPTQFRVADALNYVRDHHCIELAAENLYESLGLDEKTGEVTK